MPHFVLFALRLLAVASITFLLFAPHIRSVEKTLEKPVIILAQDNSASLIIGSSDSSERTRYSASVKKLYEALSRKYQVDTLLLGDSVRAGFRMDLKDRSTNINSLFQKIRSLYAGRNVGAIILASDGLYNRGGDPLAAALSLRAPVYSVALGDSNESKDLRISNIHYNELIQAGNDFEISLQIEAYQSKGNQPRIRVYRGKELLFSKILNIHTDDFRYNLPIVLPAQRAGTSRYTVRVDTLPNERSFENNIRDFYLQAQDLKKNILIVSDAPHPDISAIRQSLQTAGSYEVRFLYVQDLKPVDVTNADLLILYQLPSQRTSLGGFLSSIKSKPVWYVLGAQSDLPAFSSMQSMLDLKASPSGLESSATINPSFQAFSLPDSLSAAISGYGPLLVPFADVHYKGNHYDLLHQKVGQFNTGKPLFSFSADAEPRFGFLGGEGIWRWRLQAFQTSGSHHLVDQLLNKAVQFLLADADKRRFRVYSSQQIYTSSEPVIFNAELYDESLELVNKPDVSLTLHSAAGSIFSYQFSRMNNSYIMNLGALTAGEYTYKASTKLGNTSYKAEGKLLISADQLEYQEVRANHQLLYQLARQSGGELFYPRQLDDMANSIGMNETLRTVSYENTTMSDLMSMKWILGFICGLMFCEWFLRKRGGDL
ncbi:hypothetical protein B0I27_102307 [Arcticibacter pallidicorallinus]|uniref:VWA domain-containing protein n=2 Tax=Arcticibacter pallidicorallinus TaxID=1259464 RepID=A0A2T0U9E2_9SPHI|nr:hypothetical protein B0I27_102307 [Arcticibacter pallidicorallinus]